MLAYCRFARMSTQRVLSTALTAGSARRLSHLFVTLCGTLMCNACQMQQYW